MFNFNIFSEKIVNRISTLREKSTLKMPSTFLNNWGK